MAPTFLHYLPFSTDCKKMSNNVVSLKRFFPRAMEFCHLVAEASGQKMCNVYLRNTAGDAPYTKSIYALLSRSIVWSLLLLLCKG